MEKYGKIPINISENLSENLYEFFKSKLQDLKYYYSKLILDRDNSLSELYRTNQEKDELTYRQRTIGQILNSYKINNLYKRKISVGFLNINNSFNLYNKKIELFKKENYNIENELNFLKNYIDTLESRLENYKQDDKLNRLYKKCSNCKAINKYSYLIKDEYICESCVNQMDLEILGEEKCQICYNYGFHKVILKCNNKHIICKNCYIWLINSDTIKCPYCKKEF